MRRNRPRRRSGIPRATCYRAVLAGLAGVPLDGDEANVRTTRQMAFGTESEDCDAFFPDLRRLVLIERFPRRAPSWTDQGPTTNLPAMSAERATRRCILALEDGILLTGTAFGATGTQTGEVVFNTAMTGYQEIITDPS